MFGVLLHFRVDAICDSMVQFFFYVHFRRCCSTAAATAVAVIVAAAVPDYWAG